MATPKRVKYRALEGGARRFRVLVGPISTRLERTSDQWIDWKTGAVIEGYPAHLPVDELLASGNLEEITDGEE